MRYAFSRVNTDRGGKIEKYIDAETLVTIASVETDRDCIVNLHTKDGKVWPKAVRPMDAHAICKAHLANMGYTKEANPGHFVRIPGDPSPFRSMCD